MRQLLAELATIKTGMLARPTALGTEDTAFIQVKHFAESGRLIAEPLAEILSDTKSEKYLLKRGDILFAAKGGRIFASLYEWELPAVASSSFFVIRLHTSKVLPDYLAWFLNLDTTLSAIKAQALGTSMPSVPKTVLEAIEVPIISLQKQQTISKVAELQVRQYELSQQLSSLKNKYITNQLIQSLR